MNGDQESEKHNFICHKHVLYKHTMQKITDTQIKWQSASTGIRPTSWPEGTRKWEMGF